MKFHTSLLVQFINPFNFPIECFISESLKPAELLSKWHWDHYCYQYWKITYSSLASRFSIFFSRFFSSIFLSSRSWSFPFNEGDNSPNLPEEKRNVRYLWKTCSHCVARKALVIKSQTSKNLYSKADSWNLLGHHLISFYSPVSFFFQ